jgi:hypothetical protein
VTNLSQGFTDNNTANGESRDAAARLFNTSAGYISYAGRLRETAPELFADVRNRRGGSQKPPGRLENCRGGEI